MLKNHMYNLPHLIFLSLFLLALIVQSAIIAKKRPSEKAKKIYTSILSVIIIIGVVLTRVSTTMHNTRYNINNYKWYYFIPDTWCSLNGIVYALNILVFKRNQKMLSFTAFLGFLGGIMAIFFPNFLSTMSFFDIRALPSMIYHACMILLSLYLVESKDFIPTIKNAPYFALGMIICMIIGSFEKRIMHMPCPMQLDQPFFDKTPFLYHLTSWYTVILGEFIFVSITCLIFDYHNSKNKINEKLDNNPKEFENKDLTINKIID